MPEMMESTCMSNGARLVSVEGLRFALRSVDLRAQAEGGIARVVVSQIFANPHEQPLKAAYTMPLPAGGAVAGYRFRIGERLVIGEIDCRAKARERFEAALIEGRTAGLLDQERSNLFTQELGNIPPRTEVAVEITVDQRLDWLSEGMWQWRFPTVVAPRYLGAPGRVSDAPRVTVDVADGPTGVRACLDLLVRDAVAGGRPPESPSHRLSARDERIGTRVELADEAGVALDRDLVVRWAVARPRAGISVQVARPAAGRGDDDHAYGLVTIVPPEPAGAQVIPRDLILLLDTSGSMTGRPLDQAKRVVGMLIDSLGESDRLEMIAFANAPRRWRSGAVAATEPMRREAHAWLADLAAGGGTEMLSAVQEALRPLRDGAQRQVVIVTDGEIGFEGEVVSALCSHLPAGSRFHAVGVGSAVNGALLRPAARAGRGACIVADLDEDAERGAARLIAATRGPVVVDLEISGAAVSGCAPRRLPDLLAGAPVLASLRLRPGGGDVVVRGRAAGGQIWEQRLTVSAAEAGAGDPAVIALYAREAVEDLEIDLAAGGERQGIDSAIEKIGLAFGISTRLTSWVAISTEPNVDPSQPVRRVVIPQELPYGMSAEGLGLRPAGGMAMAMQETASVHDTLHAAFAMPRREWPRFRKALRGLGVFPGRWVGAMPPDLQVLEFEVLDSAVDWDPAPTAILHMSDGAQIEVTIDLARSTVSGAIQPGSLVRIALSLAARLRDGVVEVMIESAGRPLWVIRIQS